MPEETNLQKIYQNHLTTICSTELTKEETWTTISGLHYTNEFKKKTARFNSAPLLWRLLVIEILFNASLIGCLIWVYFATHDGVDGVKLMERLSDLDIRFDQISLDDQLYFVITVYTLSSFFTAFGIYTIVSKRFKWFNYYVYPDATLIACISLFRQFAFLAYYQKGMKDFVPHGWFIYFHHFGWFLLFAGFFTQIVSYQLYRCRWRC